MAKETVYIVEHLFRRRGKYSWEALRTYTDKKSAIKRAKMETGKNIVKVEKSLTMFDNGEKQW